MILIDDTEPFPGHQWANEDGLLAIGADLSYHRLLLAYTRGIFPWEANPVPYWFSPQFRFIITRDYLNIPRSVKRGIKKTGFSVTFDRCFEQVMHECQKMPRRGQYGTWISDQMITAYTRMHQQGYAHSVEVWQQDELVGGLYGLALGRMFAGESMFSKDSEGSKTGFVALMLAFLNLSDGLFIDAQVYNPSIVRYGAVELPRVLYHELLMVSLDSENRKTLAFDLIDQYGLFEPLPEYEQFLKSSWGTMIKKLGNDKLNTGDLQQLMHIHKERLYQPE